MNSAANTREQLYGEIRRLIIVVRRARAISRTALWLALVLLSTSCSSTGKLSSLDIQGPEDSIVLGRLRFLAGDACSGDFRLPGFELVSTATGTSIPYAASGVLRFQEGQMVEIPMVKKLVPGTYQLRMKSVEAPPQSPWLKNGYLTLTSFSVNRGQLVYFGTIEIEIECAKMERQSATRYVSHSVADDFWEEITLFRENFPQVYEMYREKIVLEVE